MFAHPCFEPSRLFARDSLHGVFRSGKCAFAHALERFSGRRGHRLRYPRADHFPFRRINGNVNAADWLPQHTLSQAQSFTEAAKRLHVPKSSVGRAVTRLERRLGIRLMARTTRTVALTDAGDVYLRHGKRILEQAEEADVAIGGMVGSPRGTLRGAAPVAFARGILAPILGTFMHRYPELRLQLELLNTSRQYRDGSLVFGTSKYLT